MAGRELLTPDEVRKLDNRYALLFIRGASPVMDEKYDLMGRAKKLSPIQLEVIPSQVETGS